MLVVVRKRFDMFVADWSVENMTLDEIIFGMSQRLVYIQQTFHFN